MSKENPQVNPLDELARGLRDLVDELERLVNPNPPKPARVPVPVRPPERHSPR